MIEGMGVGTQVGVAGIVLAAAVMILRFALEVAGKMPSKNWNGKKEEMILTCLQAIEENTKPLSGLVFDVKELRKENDQSLPILRKTHAGVVRLLDREK